MATKKEDELNNYRFQIMEENIREIKDAMKEGFRDLNDKMDWLGGKFPSIEQHLENKKKIDRLEEQVEKINMKIAWWAGSIVVLAYILIYLWQQIFERIWK